MILLLFGCISPETVYHVNRSLPGHSWDQRDTLCFRIDSLECKRTYEVTVEGRFLETFPYQQLHLKLLVGKASPSPIIIDIGGNRANKDQVFLNTAYAQAVTFAADTTSVEIRLVHGMKLEKLPGISDMGIHVRDLR
ncbi:MAG: hypothetical protein HUJ99_07960 [Bacteroidaceae bacterium]|nr:hypothetical protein [Bacteroidaceae bacterium]